MEANNRADNLPIPGGNKGKSYIKVPSRKQAIDAKCRECIYDPKANAGQWRQQVDGCTSPGCPLYPVRPRPIAVGDSDE